MARPIFVCGVVLLVALATVSCIDARAEPIWFVGLMGAASLAYLAALWFVVHRPEASRQKLAVCLLLSFGWRLALIGGAPLVSDDVYRYIWDGRVQRHGVNPYKASPDDPTLAHLHTELTQLIDPASAELPAIYPPAAELFFRVVTMVDESVTAMTVAVVLCDLLTILVLWRWLYRTGRNPWLVLAYAWHPLVALEGAGGAHIDIVGTLVVVSSAYALSRQRSCVAAVALAVSVSVKFLPIVLVPLLWRRIRVRDGIVAASVALLLYLPFYDGSLMLPVGSLGIYAEQWRFNGPIFAWLEPWLGTLGVLTLATGSGLGIAAIARRRLGRDDPDAWAWPMATALLLMPVVYSWYLVWLTPFLTSRTARPLMVWTLASLLTYLVWISQLANGEWVLPAWVEPVEYGLAFASGLWVWTVWQRRDPSDRPPVAKGLSTC